jgi:uncharacterized protein YecE (DUF72 family)
MNVWIGTSGYSYPDWVGPFYPPGTKSTAMLPYYARQFPLVELNFTFYRPPTPAMLARMADAAPAGFQFVVKLPRSLSHEEKTDDLATFRASVQQMKRRDCLLGLLCQLPQSSHYTQKSLGWLDTLGKELSPYHLAVEFRHRSWDRPDLATWLGERRIDLVSVDVPDVPALYPRGLVQSTERIYVRFHSRIVRNWYQSDKDRYDYEYDDAALTEWIQQITRSPERTQEVLFLFNNCVNHQAVTNARRMAQIVPKLMPQARVVTPPPPAQRSLFE